MQESQTNNHKLQTPSVGIIMGSDSGMKVMEEADKSFK